MDPRLAGIYLIAKELGGFRNGDLEDRVFLQKAIYLIQLLGIDLRFRFSWYLRGPYSRELSQCIYDIAGDSQMREVADRLELRHDVVPVIDKLKEWLATRPDSIPEVSRWFELLGSIHYVKHISQPHSTITIDNIGEHLRKAEKTSFQQTEIESAWWTLDRADLIRNKHVDIRGATPTTA